MCPCPYRPVMRCPRRDGGNKRNRLPAGAAAAAPGCPRRPAGLEAAAWGCPRAPPLPAGLERCWAAGGPEGSAAEGTENSALGGRALRTVLPVVIRWPGERSGGGGGKEKKI